MRLLTKIKLINWHFFTNETIPIDGNTLITGDNGAGKSTLIDALQLVIVADLRKIRFNSSAFEDRTTRDLRSYLRGKTGAEGEAAYLRNENFTSYVVLEITRTTTGKPYLIGVVCDYYHATGEEEHVFFKIDEEPLRDELFFNEPLLPYSRREFFDYLRAREIKHTNYRHDLGRYIQDLRQLFGGAKESFFSLFSKGISFSPITDLRKFVYDYILEEKVIDVETMRDYFEKFREVERIIEDTKKEIAALEQIEQRYRVIENLRRQLDLGGYMVQRAQWELQQAKLAQKSKEKEEAGEALEELVRRIEDFKERQRALEESIAGIKQEIAENEAFKRERELQRSINELRKELERLRQLEKNLRSRFKQEAGEATELHRVMQQLEAPLPLTQPLLEAAEIWQAAACGPGVDFPEDWAKLASGWQEAMEWLLLHKGGREKEARSRREQIARLKEDLRGLAENQVLGRDSPPMQLKRILEEELRTRNGEPVPVDIFCEAMEIRDPAWRNAIEGYLYHRKFDILVPPDYFKAALALYRKYRLSHGLEDAGLVNTASLLQEAPVAPERSLASEIDAEIDYIRAYADRLLGGVVKCESEDELPQHAAAITPAGMLYQDHSIRQIPRAYFELPYIGKEAVRFQLARKREALQEEERLLAEAERQIAAAASAGYLALDKTDRYRAWAQELEQLQGKAGLEEDLAAQERELLSLDSGELDRLKENLSRRESSLGSLKKELERAIGERGGLEERISNLGGAIEALQQAAEAERAGCEAYLAALPGELPEECVKKWEREAARKSPAELYQNYRSSNEGANTRLEKLRPALVKLRTEFVYAFHFSGDPGAEDNEAFRQRQRLLVESHLQDYEARARAAREQAEQSFQENFVARLGEFIKLAEEEIKELNRALKDMRFGTDAYRFSLTPKKDTRRYYEMIMDTGVYQGSIFREAFFQKHGDTITDLFNEITRGGDDFPENVQLLTDYRSYLDFDIIITDTHNHKSYFSKVARDKSGGETQVPFYVAILASFYQAYQLYRKSDTLRLVVFDEAFNRMDADRIEEAIAFMKNLGFQAVVVAPTGRIQLIVPYMNTNLIVMREGFHSFIERAGRKDLERWS
ncbi:MAG TPA: SbcC/MukB-like Walker B domain-containing protein [Bacillota bacterium]|nr:SbcC/MukB-like Walker B domain-containing protein [Bacillota bacterium]HPZ11251.1 SbcC/MukB-like Walker B domain-containing protein [Bacillota bacterium]HQE09319.1 SbcC/MukB-like Walker B domain-containing protein [Bacillota bacterium]